MENISLICIQCDAEYTFTVNDQLRHKRSGFTEPLRCPECRRHRLKGKDSPDKNKRKIPGKRFLPIYDIGLDFDDFDSVDSHYADSLDLDDIDQIAWRLKQC